MVTNESRPMTSGADDGKKYGESIQRAEWELSQEEEDSYTQAAMAHALVSIAKSLEYLIFILNEQPLMVHATVERSEAEKEGW